MALRPIDNALPTTPERPKKQPKVALATQKQQDRAGVNGENIVPLPSSGDATVDYVSSDNLKPLSDPEVKIQVCVCSCFCSFVPLKNSNSLFFGALNLKAKHLWKCRAWLKIWIRKIGRRFVSR